MLSFLRSRISRSPSHAAAPRVVRWDGAVLEVDGGPSLAHAPIAIDLDRAFFDETRADGDGRARFAFAFSPPGRARAIVQARRGRDGAVLDIASEIRFGEPGLQKRAADASGSLADVGAFVPFGADCATHDVAIVVPVYNAPALVERCIDSVLEHTTGRARLIVIDDASPDPKIAPLLDRYASRAHVRILRNERNRGFTATANRGIVEAGRADVVLLNADTEVGSSWLTGLRRAAASGDDVATVTAVSDNAGAFSVPEVERENAWPAQWSFAETARALWQHAGRCYPELPTGNGFCMYIRRAALDAVGLLDEAAFPQGYGEENDFCQRASARGQRHLVAGNVYVRHARSASFGDERRQALGRTGMAVLRERWPHYEADVAATLHSFERRVLDWRVRRIFADASLGSPELRVLDASGLAPSIDDEALWRRLQADAIDAIVSDTRSHARLRPIAAALGVPLVQIARGENANDAAASAIRASRSFAERSP